MAISSPLLTWDRDLHHQRPWLSSPWTWLGAQHQLSSSPASRFWGPTPSLHKHSRAVSIYLHLWARMNLLVVSLENPAYCSSLCFGWSSRVAVLRVCSPNACSSRPHTGRTALPHCPKTRFGYGTRFSKWLQSKKDLCQFYFGRFRIYDLLCLFFFMPWVMTTFQMVAVVSPQVPG